MVEITKTNRLKQILDQPMDRKDFFVKAGSFLLVIGWVSVIAKLFVGTQNSDSIASQPQSEGYGTSGYGVS